jgi:hypothetical protein
MGSAGYGAVPYVVADIWWRKIGPLASIFNRLIARFPGSGHIVTASAFNIVNHERIRHRIKANLPGN